MTVPKRWEVVTEDKLCFRSLADGHRREACLRSRVCGLNGCRSAHHRMLREGETDNKTTEMNHIIRSDLISGSAGGTAEEGGPSERTHMTTTIFKLTVPTEFVALQTVPVYLTNGSKRVKVNALLGEVAVGRI